MNHKVWVLGHGRSGTQYTASLFRQAGWDVPAEVEGEDGIASWQYAVCAQEAWWGSARGTLSPPRLVLHVVRDPVETIPSIAFTEHGSEACENWRKRWIFIPEDPDPVVRAIWSYVNWNLLCRAQATHAVQTPVVHEFVSEWTGVEVKPSTGHNAKPHPKLSEEDIIRSIKDPATSEAWDRAKQIYLDTPS